MKTLKSRLTVAIMLTVIISLFVTTSCKDKVIELQSSTYNLQLQDVLGLNGTVTFTEKTSSSVTIDISLTGASQENHPAELCANTIVEGGPIVLTLNPVDASGKSSTVITTMNYSQLNMYDGFVQVRKSTSQPTIILAKGDIGGNLITATNKSYALSTVGAFGVSGTALFEKRVNGNTLVTISVTGTIDGEYYPASINVGSVATVGGGTVKKTLSMVDGITGKSYTNIRKLDNNTVVNYDNWLVYDGYLIIYQNNILQANIISQGNIGSN